jgi:hypothetical protein
VRRAAWLAVLLVTRVAAAQEPEVDDQACERERHAPALTRAAELYEQGKDAEAAAIWEQVLRELGASCAWKLHFNLALALERSGHVDGAIAHYDAFVRFGTPHAADAYVAHRLATAADRSRALQQQHAALEVPPADHRVQIGDAAPRRAGFVVYLPPGEHRVTIDPGTPGAREMRVALRRGQRHLLSFDQPREAPPPAPRPFPSAWVISGAVLTLASVGLPVGLYFYTQSLRSDAEPLLGTEAYQGPLDDFRAARTGYHVSYALPAAFALATTAVVVVHFAGDDGPSSTALELRGNGLELRGSF